MSSGSETVRDFTPLNPGGKLLLASWAAVERAFAADAAGGLLAVLGPGWSGASSGANLPRWVREKLLEAEASPQPSERGVTARNEGETRLCASYLLGLPRAVYPS